jgi:ADP-ribosylglycohydrolase
MTRELTIRDRAEGALWGLLLGDALAMPVHWYYDRDALRRDYGEVRDLLAPRNPHPGSILHRSHYAPANPDADILHDQARYWGRPGIHYHQHLEAGENTLNLQLVRVLLADLVEHGRYDADRYLERMIAFVRDPESHRDTYVEEWLRAFFEHRELTHKGPAMAAALDAVADVLLPVLAGKPLRNTLDSAAAQSNNRLLQRDFEGWEPLEDLEVIGRILSPACYVEDSVPATLYLARKYAERPEDGLVANTMAGGDNCYRGAVLGALLGAASGVAGWPERWRRSLRYQPAQLARRGSAGT